MTEHAVPLDDKPYDQAMQATRPKRIRLTIRLDPERVERARKAVKKGRAPSINAWIEEAVRKYDSRFGWDENWREYFDELDRLYGPPSEEARARARRIVYGA
jgi:hypothetical protein